MMEMDGAVVLEIQVHAGMIGLVEPPPGIGSFDAGWRAIHDVPPDELASWRRGTLTGSRDDS